MNFAWRIHLCMNLLAVLGMGCTGDSDERVWRLDVGEGVLVQLPHQELSVWHLQVATDGDWTTVATLRRGFDPNPVPFWLGRDQLPDSSDGIRWRNVSGRVVSVEDYARPLLSVDFEDHVIVGSEERLDVSLLLNEALFPSIRASIVVERPSESDQDHWSMRETCREGDSWSDCFGENSDFWTLLEPGIVYPVPEWSRLDDSPAEHRIRVELSTSTMSQAGRREVSWTAWEHEYWSLGGRYVWGDPHAQSNLSWDGCEVDVDSCESRYGRAASDFFEQARFAGLDFAALTDSSETGSYFPNGMLAKEYPVWQGQIEAVQNAQREDFVALLGYEWSPHDLERAANEAPWNSGARVVLFANDSVCESYRVAAQRAQVNFTKGTAVYTPTLGEIADTTSSLYNTFDWAAGRCGYEPLVSFAAHPMGSPWTDWGRPENQENPLYESLFEIFSERGFFECSQNESSDCSVPGTGETDGSFRSALVLGRRFGVAASTDAHDGRPGSLSDGPSARWLYGTESGPEYHSFSGGLTGVLITGQLNSLQLIEGMQRRHTVATTGPRPAMKVMARGQDKRFYVPGDVVSEAAWPLQVRMVLPETEGTTYQLHWIDVEGGPSDAIADFSAEIELAKPAGLAVYGRLGISPSDDMIWISPFFRE